jgi:hypothetical protein
MLKLYAAEEDWRRKWLNIVWWFKSTLMFQGVYRQGHVRRAHDDVRMLARHHIAGDFCYHSSCWWMPSDNGFVQPATTGLPHAYGQQR